MNDGNDAGSRRIAVLGGGNLGRALALGWAGSGRVAPDRITVTRRHPKTRLAVWASSGLSHSAGFKRSAYGPGRLFAKSPKLSDRPL